MNIEFRKIDKSIKLFVNDIKTHLSFTIEAARDLINSLNADFQLEIYDISVFEIEAFIKRKLTNKEKLDLKKQIKKMYNSYINIKRWA